MCCVGDRVLLEMDSVRRVTQRMGGATTQSPIDDVGGVT